MVGAERDHKNLPWVSSTAVSHSSVVRVNMIAPAIQVRILAVSIKIYDRGAAGWQQFGSRR